MSSNNIAARVRAKRRAEPPEPPLKPFADTSTTLEENEFDENLLAENNISHFLLNNVRQIATIVPEKGTLRSLLEDLFKANTATNAQLSPEEKQLLDYEEGDCDRILGAQFKEQIGDIPNDNEGEWIARCHNRLSELFRNFKTWKACSVVSAVINEGVKPDRIFGFNFVPKNEFDAEVLFPGWHNTGICWPFLLIESKPLSYQKKVGDKWKMAIIEAFAVEEQTKVLKDLNVPLDSTFVVHESHLPISFGVYYVGDIVRISVYFILGQQRCFVQLPALSLTANAANILKMFAVMKIYSGKMHESITKAFSQRRWGGQDIPVDDIIHTIEPENSHVSSEKSEKADSESTFGGQSTTAVDKKLAQKSMQLLYKNKRSAINLVCEQQQYYVVKTTSSTLASREYRALIQLQGLAFVPTLFTKPVNCGDLGSFAMSWCPGVHPRTFATYAELQRFMWALLLALQAIHKRGAVHNDIKESNVIWNSATSVAYLIDFGCTTAINGETQAHTRGYNAPDHVKTPASDVYSAGIVLMNIILSIGIQSRMQAKTLHECSTVEEALQWKLEHPQISFGAAKWCNDQSFDLGRKMIARNAAERITIKKALKHPFFESNANQQTSAHPLNIAVGSSPITSLA